MRAQDVDKETSRLVVSHRKAVVDSQIHDLSVGSVLKGVVTAVKPYGAFVDIGGMSGLLHISQISCDHISNVESVIPVGTTIKCMVISQDKGKGRVALSTKTLEQEPGDMIKDQAKVRHLPTISPTSPPDLPSHPSPQTRPPQPSISPDLPFHTPCWPCMPALL